MRVGAAVPAAVQRFTGQLNIATATRIKRERISATDKSDVSSRLGFDKVVGFERPQSSVTKLSKTRFAFNALPRIERSRGDDSFFGHCRKVIELSRVKSEISVTRFDVDF